MTREGRLGTTRTVSSEGHASAHSLVSLQTTLTLLHSQTSTRVLSLPSPLLPTTRTPAPVQLQLYLELWQPSREVTAPTYLPLLRPNLVHPHHHVPSSTLPRQDHGPRCPRWRRRIPHRAPTTPTSTTRATPLQGTATYVLPSCPTMFTLLPLRTTMRPVDCTTSN